MAHVDYYLLPKVNVYLEWAQSIWLAPKSTKGKPLGFHMIGGNYPINLDTPTMIGWIMVVGCTENQVLGKSPIWVLFQP